MIKLARVYIAEAKIDVEIKKINDREYSFDLPDLDSLVEYTVVLDFEVSSLIGKTTDLVQAPLLTLSYLEHETDTA